MDIGCTPMFKVPCMLFLLASIEGFNLYVPPAGNCGADTVLTCQETGDLTGTFWIWQKDSVNIVNNGGAVDPGDINKYIESRGSNLINLTITDTQLSDVGSYSCSVGFGNKDTKPLEFECKASSFVPQIGLDKRLKLTVDRLYPTPIAFAVSTSPQQITGSYNCNDSTQYPGYKRCVWTSQCLSAGTYNYAVTVKTVTQASPLTGSQIIVSPYQPVISNSETISGNRLVVRPVEGQPATLECTSRNGVPQSTLAWYRNSTSTTALKRADTDVLSYQITPTRKNDMDIYVCRSWYPHTNAGCTDSKTETVMLYLSLIPSQSTVSQTNTVNEGEQATFQCTSTGSRPAASLLWTFRGQPVTGPTTDTEQAADETFTMRSSYSPVVTRQDNNQQVGCTVTHPSFTAQIGNTTIIVRYAPDISVTIWPSNAREGLAIQIDCSAAGKPTNYTYKGFTHSWRGTTVRSYPGNYVTITSLGLEHSGTYTCVANNGIPDLAGNVDQKGSKAVLVKVKPKILTTQHEFHGSTVEPVNARIPFYSYPPYTSLDIKRQGISIASDTRVTIDTSPGEVTDTFFDVGVTLDGHIVTLVISDPSDMDISNYTLEIQNEVNITTWPFWISLSSVPDPPTNFRYLDPFTLPMFIWEAGVNGGYEQTFVIEVAREGSDAWTEKVHVLEVNHKHLIQDGMYAADVVGLDTGSYTAMISSRNRLGSSNYVELASTFTVSATVFASEAKQQTSVGAIAGGVVAGIEALIIVAIVVVLLLRRRKSTRKDAVKRTNDKSEKVQMTETRANTQQFDGENSASNEGTGEDKPNVYETLDPELKSGSLYDTPEPKSDQRRSDASKELYINMNV